MHTHTHTHTHTIVLLTSKLICVTRLLHTCKITHLYVMTKVVCVCVCTHTQTHAQTHWRHLQLELICVTWLIHTCDMTHPQIRHDLLIGVTWLIHMCDMTHLHVLWHDSFICVTRVTSMIRAFIRVIRVTRMLVACYGLALVSSINSIIGLFRKRAL